MTRHKAVLFLLHALVFCNQVTSQETIDAPWPNEISTSGCSCTWRPWHHTSDYLMIQQLLKLLKEIRNSCQNETRRIEQLQQTQQAFHTRVQRLESKVKDVATETQRRCGSGVLDEAVRNGSLVVLTADAEFATDVPTFCRRFSGIARKRQNSLPHEEMKSRDSRARQTTRRHPNDSLQKSNMPPDRLSTNLKVPLVFDDRQNSNGAGNINSSSRKNPDQKVRRLGKRVQKLENREKNNAADIKRLNGKIRRQGELVRRLSRDIDALNASWTQRMNHVINRVHKETLDARNAVGEILSVIKNVKKGL